MEWELDLVPELLNRILQGILKANAKCELVSLLIDQKIGDCGVVTEFVTVTVIITVIVIVVKECSRNLQP